MRNLLKALLVTIRIRKKKIIGACLVHVIIVLNINNIKMNIINVKNG